MPRSARLTLLSLGLALIVFPLGIVRPGWPPTLKADEPAYYGMALSLAHDLDVRCDLEDVRRLTDSYPYLPIKNLILMSDDGWETAYYGKPYVFSLVAAPAVRLFGEHGMVAVNMALLVAMIWMGSVYLRRFNSWTVSFLFAAGFLVLSTAFAYVFWLQPEIFNMFSVFTCLFLAFHRPEPTPRSASPVRQLLWTIGSGAVLALAVYNKPAFAAMGLPALWVVYKRKGLKAAVAWVVAAALALGLLAGIGYGLSGHPSAYLGVARGGVHLDDPGSPDDYLASLRRFVKLRGDEQANAWTWIFRIPEIDPVEFRDNVSYFFWGRHTGMLFYMPFAALAFLLFLLQTPRSSARWILVGSAAIVALFFIIFIPFNWHGGGGFVGNRYFISVYPGLLFLATKIKPRAVIPVGYLAGALLIGPIVFTPFGAPVPNPTLQAHTRNFPFRALPLELSVKKNVPGYSGFNLGNVRLLARADRVAVRKEKLGQMWIQGAVETEVLLLSGDTLESVLFEVETLAQPNEVRLVLGDQEQVVSFGDSGKHREVIELFPTGPDRRSSYRGSVVNVYRLRVLPSEGSLARRPDGSILLPRFYFGASLTYLGRREQLEEENHYRVTWRRVAADSQVAPGAVLHVLARLRNDGETPWSSTGPVGVNLAYHWLDADGNAVLFEGERTSFPDEIAPKETTEVMMSITAPPQPGRYTLQLDLVREKVAWFSRRGAATYSLEVDVDPAATSDPTSEKSP